MTDKRFSFRAKPWLAALFLMVATLLPSTGCSLFPGHQQAELKKRVNADSFPTADKALGTSVAGSGNRSPGGN